MLVPFALIAALIAAYWQLDRIHRDLTKIKELWKSYALALEVENECLEEFYAEPYGEGCGTRSKRRASIAEQRHNALNAEIAALAELIHVGEYA